VELQILVVAVVVQVDQTHLQILTVAVTADLVFASFLT
jgi:hypothetical protein